MQRFQISSTWVGIWLEPNIIGISEEVRSQNGAGQLRDGDPLGFLQLKYLTWQNHDVQSLSLLAIERNWKTPAKFLCCPNELGPKPL
ncbi:MAG: hypothetical protein ACI9GB_003841 [Halioglobus sp.]|jgi:hypothetical protein